MVEVGWSGWRGQGGHGVIVCLVWHHRQRSQGTAGVGLWSEGRGLVTRVQSALGDSVVGVSEGCGLVLGVGGSVACEAGPEQYMVGSDHDCQQAGRG